VRVTKSDGLIIITTPNKKLRLLPFQRPWNIDHEKEYSLKDLKKLFNKRFNQFKIQGILARNEIMQIEISRVKQNPFSIYIYEPLIRFLEKLRIWNIIKNNIIMITKRKVKRVNYFHNWDYNIKDFFLSNQNLNKSIDFFVIIQNE